MKSFLTIIILLSRFTTFSQTQIINSIPKSGLLLNSGWRFHAEDNPEFAKVYYHDSDWQSVDPTRDIHDMPALWKNNIVWFRLHFTIADSIDNGIALIMQQSGASEIYLNGNLIEHFGILNSKISEIKAYDPDNKPFYVATSKSVVNILAVRYALEPGISYSVHINRQNPVFRIHINNLETAIETYRNSGISVTTSNFFRTGVYFIFLILHVAFYLYYPKQKANLYFSLYALL
ncbi:MAG TPA: hypothetical protein VN958_08420, partial [Chitinophagaceae bacterium]|nr:hypothetical protein [Chitinophagaceae bacterium]